MSTISEQTHTNQTSMGQQEAVHSLACKDNQIECYTQEDKEFLNDLLTNTFNSILRIEEQSVHNRLTAGLSIAELHTIVAIGLHESNPMNVIATRLNITLATLTSAITKLEKKGFVERMRSEKDRRQVLVHLTTDGRKAYRAHDLFHKKMVDNVLDQLNPEEERIFINALTKVKEFFDQENQSFETNKAQKKARQSRSTYAAIA